MFVLNDMTRDRRVIKEAASLVSVGWNVTVMATQNMEQNLPAIECHPDGFEIHRHALRSRPLWLPSRRTWVRLRGQYFAQVRRLKSRRVKLQGKLTKVLRLRRAAIRRYLRALGLNFDPPQVYADAPAGESAYESTFANLAHSFGMITHGTYQRIRRTPNKIWRLAARTQQRLVRAARQPFWRARRRRLALLLNLPLSVAGAVASDLTAITRFLFGSSASLIRQLAIAATWAPQVIAAALINVFLGVPYLVLDRLSSGTLDWIVRVLLRWSAWARVTADAAGVADVYHGHDLSAVWGAILAHRRYGGKLVYDSHEVFLESGRWAQSPWFVRALATQFEQPVLRRAAALIAVNPQVIEELAKRYEIPERQVVVYNCPPAWNPGPPGTELRAAIGVDAAAQVVLYHGGFSAHRGLEELLEAKRDPRLANAHLVFLGYGPLEPTLRAAATDPAYGGRVHVLEAVSPEVLDRWVSGADVGMCTVLPSTLNHRISTPNKLFESIGAGVPVIASDFPTMRNIVLGDPDGPLGAVCDPTNARDVATAIHSILSMSPGDRAALRARCIRAAAARWNWEAQAARLTELYRSLPPTTSA